MARFKNILGVVVIVLRLVHMLSTIQVMMQQ